MGMAMVIATCVWPPPFHMLLSSLQHVWLPLLSTLSGSKVTLMFGDIACCKRLACVREFSAETLLSFPVLSFLEDMRDLSLHIHHSHNHLHRSCFQNNVPKAFPESGPFLYSPKWVTETHTKLFVRQRGRAGTIPLGHLDPYNSSSGMTAK